MLILEDEPTLRSSMARGLGRLPGVEVAEAGTLAEALEVLDRVPPRLVLSDIDLPDRSGIEILGELGKRGLRVPVVFISAYLKAYGSQIPPHADVEVCEKPIGLEELRQLVTARLGQPRADDEAEPFTPADYLQLACLGRRSVAITVEAPAPAGGQLLVVNGTLWSAADGQGCGLAAFRRLVRSGGVTRCHTLRGDPGTRDLHEGWEALLIDAMRQADEEAAGIEHLVETPVPPAAGPPPPPPLDEFEALEDEGVTALLRRDHATAVRAFRRALELRPGHAGLQAKLDRLRELGHDA